ncbi:hypothetical protein BDV10DRAFT_177054 [Aspergillus recurvatus]
MLSTNPPAAPVVLLNVSSIPSGTDKELFLETWRLVIFRPNSITLLETVTSSLTMLSGRTMRI